MILIKITRENREPKVGEWYYCEKVKDSDKLAGDYCCKSCKALSLSVIIDAPEYWNELSKCGKNAYAGEFSPISNTEEMFQWLYENGKLREEWVEIGDAYFDRQLVIGEEIVCLKPLNEINNTCPNLSCHETYPDWQERLFNHMADSVGVILTDTEMRDVYDCIVKFDPEKETKRFKS